ncbi:MAG: prepilin-type N-terminal cleavage/methylation domain-containing protein [Puniceicoccales bacterium]|jgi:hypothetical protein|nr:prepilin-type N-terminal cleavage/methylation domain-containing protein [Puniceicoccales bacterium]
MSILRRQGVVCPRRNSAFTLVEILIAIAMTALLLTALSMLTFQVMGVWASQAEDPLFDRHVDGLRRALEECVAETADSANSQGNIRATNTVFRQAPSTVNADSPAYLRITGAPPFLVSDTMPLGNIHAWLAFDPADGLILYWQTDYERSQNQDATHRQVLSPWVESVTYFSYNSNDNAWDESDNPSSIRTGSSIFMQLNLNHRGQTRKIMLPLTDAAPHNLNY